MSYGLGNARRVRVKSKERVTRRTCGEQSVVPGGVKGEAIDRGEVSEAEVGTAREGVRSLWLATSRGSDRGCGSEGGRPDAPDCTTPPFSPRPFPTHGPFRAQTLTNLTLISQTRPARDINPTTHRRLCSAAGGAKRASSLLTWGSTRARRGRI